MCAGGPEGPLWVVGGRPLEHSDDMREFLVCYDYGTGGLWWWIAAPSEDAIHAAFRDMVVFDAPPHWWSEENDAHARHVQLDTDDKVLKRLRR